MPRWYYLLEIIKKFFTLTIERPSPSDIVPEESITILTSPVGVLVNLVKLNIAFANPPKVWTPHLPDTGSMDPKMDYGHNNILIAGADEADQKKLVDFIKVGDIAVYRTTQKYAIHRIIQIGFDDKGKYFKFKGDNNPTQDPDRVRENEIQWLSIGVIF